MRHLPFRRTAVVAVLTILAVLAGSAAYAAFQGRLKGSGSASALRIKWDTAFGTTDGSGQNDPLDYTSAPARDTVDVGMTTQSLVSGEPVVTITGLYAGYKVRGGVSATVTGGGSNVFKVQSIALTAPVPAGMEVKLDPASCGLTLGSAPATIFYGIGQTTDPVADSSAFTFEVKVVPSSAYVAGNCNSF